MLPLAVVARLGKLEPTSMLSASRGPIPPAHEGSAAAFEWNRVVNGHAIDEIGKMPAGSVQAVVTSPPFWGQRVYADEMSVSWAGGENEPYGRESRPDAYVAHTLEVLAALGRILRKDGTIWWNVGDSYMTRSIARESSRDRILHYAGLKTTSWAKSPYKRYSAGHQYLKDKDLTMVPFLVALGAQKLGFWVRSIIVWSKIHKSPDGEDAPDARSVRAHVPEVVGDRPVVGHEYVLLLARSETYKYYPKSSGIFVTANGDRTALNARTVWSFPPADKTGRHAARFPGELPRRCILLGTRKNDVVFDPFAGEGTTLVEARRLGRQYLGCDASPTYVESARKRLDQLELDLDAKGASRTTR
jgi:DNA modification methylase